MSELYGPVEWSTRRFDLPKSTVVTAEGGRVHLKRPSPNRHRLRIAQALGTIAIFFFGIFPEIVAPSVESVLGTAAASGYRESANILETVAIISSAALALQYWRRAPADEESVTASEATVDPDATVEPHEISEVTIEDRQSIVAEKARLTLSTPDRDHRLVGQKSELKDLYDHIDGRGTRSDNRPEPDDRPERASAAGDAVELAENWPAGSLRAVPTAADTAPATAVDPGSWKPSPCSPDPRSHRGFPLCDHATFEPRLSRPSSARGSVRGVGRTVVRVALTGLFLYGESSCIIQLLRTAAVFQSPKPAVGSCPGSDRAQRIGFRITVRRTRSSRRSRCRRGPTSGRRVPRRRPGCRRSRRWSESGADAVPRPRGESRV